MCAAIPFLSMRVEREEHLTQASPRAAAALGAFAPPTPAISDDRCRSVAGLVVTPASSNAGGPTVQLYDDTNRVSLTVIPPSLSA